MPTHLRSATGSSILARLRDRQPCYALGIRTARSLDFVRMAASSGYDTIWIDLGHSTIPLDTVAQMAATARDLGVEPWARVPEGDFGVIGRLDGGITGLIVPQIETADDARKVASYCRYPPEGGRSQNALISTFGFRRMPGHERVEAANRAVVLQILLETQEAIDNVEEIAAVEGVDIIGLGLNDLSSHLGILWRHILCCSPDYSSQHEMPKTLSDLTQHNCMRYAFYPFGDEWAFIDAAGKTASIHIGGNVITNSAELLRLLTLQGQGLFLAPSFVVAEDLASGRLAGFQAGRVQHQRHLSPSPASLGENPKLHRPSGSAHDGAPPAIKPRGANSTRYGVELSVHRQQHCRVRIQRRWTRLFMSDTSRWRYSLVHRENSI